MLHNVFVSLHKFYFYVEPEGHEYKACGQACQVSAPEILIQNHTTTTIQKSYMKLVQNSEYWKRQTYFSSFL